MEVMGKLVRKSVTLKRKATLQKLPGAAFGVAYMDVGIFLGPITKVVVEAKRPGSLLKALGQTETGPYDLLLRQQTE